MNLEFVWAQSNDPLCPIVSASSEICHIYEICIFFDFSSPGCFLSYIENGLVETLNWFVVSFT